MPKVRLKQLAQDGATDNQVLTWNNTAGKWEADDASGGGTTILTGAVDPTTEGSTGDFYYNTVKQSFWYKDTGGWEEVGVVADDTTIEIDATNGLQVKDNGITLAKMAGGTDGNLITYDASGDPAYVATGAADQVLTSNGAGAAPTFQDAPDNSTDVTLAGTPDYITISGQVITRNAIVATTDLSATGTKDSTTFLRGDDTWAVPAGGGGASDNKPACFRVSGSSDILNTADSQMVFDTTDVSDANYSLTTGTITVTDAGTYFISYSVPINEDSTSGATRTRAYGWVEDDAAIISQSYSQCYVREASGGGGVSAGFVAVLGAGSDLELYARTQNNTNVSSESGQATLSIFKLGTG